MNEPGGTREPRPAEASFDELADAYDRYRLGYAPELYTILSAEGALGGTRVLDLACGTGLVTEELLARGAEVTGLDVSEPMLRKAASRCPGAAFRLGAAEAMPFADGAFDAAVCGQAFHWFDRSRALAECARVVRPGGVVAIWWKSLARGDAFRLVRDEVARETGLPLVPDILATGFAAFDRSALEDRSLRVVPWNVERTSEQLIGYERSRARSKASYGATLASYLERLERRLGAPDARHSLSYVHHAYLGRVPGSRFAAVAPSRRSTARRAG